MMGTYFWGRICQAERNDPKVPWSGGRGAGCMVPGRDPGEEWGRRVRQEGADGAQCLSPALRCSSRRRRVPCSDRRSTAGRPPPGRRGRVGRRRAAARPPRPARRWGQCPGARRPAARSASSTCGAPGTAASCRGRVPNAPLAAPGPGRLQAAPLPSASGQSPGRAGPRHRPLTSPGRRPHLRRPARAGLRPQPHGPRRRLALGGPASAGPGALLAAAGQGDAAALRRSGAQKRLHPMTLARHPKPLSGAGLRGNNTPPDWSPVAIVPRRGAGFREINTASDWSTALTVEAQLPGGRAASRGLPATHAPKLGVAADAGRRVATAGPLGEGGCGPEERAWGVLCPVSRILGPGWLEGRPHVLLACSVGPWSPGRALKPRRPLAPGLRRVADSSVSSREDLCIQQIFARLSLGRHNDEGVISAVKAPPRNLYPGLVFWVAPTPSAFPGSSRLPSKCAGLPPSSSSRHGGGSAAGPLLPSQ